MGTACTIHCPAPFRKFLSANLHGRRTQQQTSVVRWKCIHGNGSTLRLTRASDLGRLQATPTPWAECRQVRLNQDTCNS